jgi:ethanolamine utilization protein EutA
MVHHTIIPLTQWKPGARRAGHGLAARTEPQITARISPPLRSDLTQNIIHRVHPSHTIHQVCSSTADPASESHVTASPAEPGPSLFSFEVDQTVRLTTVGIDIGSSTSQMSVSRIELERIDNRYVTTRRELLYESDILLTPYADAETIDTAALGDFFAEQYAKAGVTHDEVDTGAIILTGLALAKHNSRNIADLFAAQAGKFVAVSAGDAIESTLACRGAGIETLSRVTGRPVVHIDMGGGTTKYSYVVGGDIHRVAAVDIGARLVLAGPCDGRRALRIEQPAALLFADAGVEVGAGDVLTDELVELIADRMAEQVLAHAGLAPDAAADARLLRTSPLFGGGQRPDASSLVTFSGGVSEYIYDRQADSFGDLGRPLAGAVLRGLEKRGLRAQDTPRGIRATVLGASQYSLQLTGNTVYASSQSLVPIRNLPVVKPRVDLDQEELDFDELAEAMGRALATRHDDDAGPVAIALSWHGSATYQRIDALARAVMAATTATRKGQSAPIVLVCDADIAGLLGQHISDVTDNAAPVLALDSIEVSEFDFLDVGAFVPGTGALPVVVKSLLFPPPAIAP